MGRRSDHTRGELGALLIEHGHRHLAEVGFANFSGREVAKRAGYSVGTIYNVFGSLDLLIAAINTRTFEIWADYVQDRLDNAGTDRIAALVHAYFSFAGAHPDLWSAIYEHRLPESIELPPDDTERRARLTAIVEDEVRTALREGTADVARLARSLIATVHGHCSLAVTGSFALMGETDPLDSALARVYESLAAHGYSAP